MLMRQLGDVGASENGARGVENVDARQVCAPFAPIGRIGKREADRGSGRGAAGHLPEFKVRV